MSPLPMPLKQLQVEEGLIEDVSLVKRDRLLRGMMGQLRGCNEKQFQVEEGLTKDVSLVKKGRLLRGMMD